MRSQASIWSISDCNSGGSITLLSNAGPMYAAILLVPEDERREHELHPVAAVGRACHDELLLVLDVPVVHVDEHREPDLDEVGKLGGSREKTVSIAARSFGDEAVGERVTEERALERQWTSLTLLATSRMACAS